MQYRQFKATKLKSHQNPITITHHFYHVPLQQFLPRMQLC